jgi:DNA-binding transcriptional regulator GbsR (MarR family)
MTTTEIRNGINKSKTHIARSLKYLEQEGYFVSKKRQPHEPFIWFRTDKEFNYTPKVKEKTKSALKTTNQITVSNTIKKPCEPKPIKTMSIEIKPDLAAMWLVSSKPQWETRFIQIVRSTGLGVRQDT